MDRDIQALNKKVMKLERELVIVNVAWPSSREVQAMFSAMQQDEPPCTPCSRRLICHAFAPPRRSVQRAPAARMSVRTASHRRLPDDQRAEALEVLHSPRFCDQTPAHVYHTLLGEGRFLYSIRTLQRRLLEAGEARERRPIRPPQAHAVPRLEATAPNQVRTWDISSAAHRRRRHRRKVCPSTRWRHPS